MGNESWIREPAVARMFYSGQPTALRRDVQRYLGSGGTEERARVIVAPHAGYMYSGAVAGAAYARARIEPRVIVMAPNHSGHGERLSLWARGSWRLPVGDLEVDEEMGARLREIHPALKEDRLAHLQEHALEVQLPFLWHRRSDVRITPIVLGPLDVRDCSELGHAIAQAVGDDPSVQVIASTDMSHYIPAAKAKAQDKKAIDRILAIDPEGLHRTVEEEDISMCGYVPTTVALFTAKALGCTEARLCRYGNSGDTSKDYDSVVGYASFLIR